MSEIKVKIDNEEYSLVITKKLHTKRMYLRVKDDLVIYVTCNVLFSQKDILNFIYQNESAIMKMIEKRKKKQEVDNDFYYLGKKYDIVFYNRKDVTLGYDKIFVPEHFNMEVWYKKMAQVIFQEELDKRYQLFVYNIPKPHLTIRKMKTRWGVCNVKTKRVTLNLELIKKDIKYLDYVIVHELSHLLHANHSKAFWKCVEDNYQDYKKVRKELKDYE